MAIGLAALPALAAPSGRDAPSAAVLLPHRVSYTLNLARLKAGSLVAAGGKASYQLRDACDSWSSSQRLEVQIMSGDGSTSTVTYQSATLEDKAGRHFLFRTVQSQDDETTSETAGEASRQRNGQVVVRFTKPETKTITLPAATVFPVQFTGQLLQAARKGMLHLQSQIFDGASIDGATPNYVTLGKLAPSTPGFDSAVFAGGKAVPISVASFGGGDAALLPDSTYSDRLWTNGVEDKLLIDFGDYVLSGQIDTLTPLPAASCPMTR
ncbi:hypothetical protein C0V97_02180 [Asaia sp. W19]|nr:hypothetical protein C0V97_02180 [Asaia sp. W19]